MSNHDEPMNLGEVVKRGEDLDLSDVDRRHLAALETKFQLVRDYTGQVASGYCTGLYLFGEGGIGKSHTVIRELERLKADYKLFNSRMTGRGVYNALERFPDSIHVLEDMEAIFRDRGAQGVLHAPSGASARTAARGRWSARSPGQPT